MEWPRTVQVVELVWFVKALIGMAIDAKLWHMAHCDEQQRRAEQRNGGVAIWAGAILWLYRGFFGMNLLAALAALPLFFQEPRAAIDPTPLAVFTSIFVAGCVIGIMVVLDAIAVFLWRARRRSDRYYRQKRIREILAARGARRPDRAAVEFEDDNP